jgi:hypothetical protein
VYPCRIIQGYACALDERSSSARHIPRDDAQ